MANKLTAKKLPKLSSIGFYSTADILGNLECGIILLDAHLNILTINQWFMDHSDLRRQLAPGDNFLDIFPAMANTQLDKSIDAALRYEIKSILTPDINMDPLPLFENDGAGPRMDKEKVSLSHVIHISPVREADGSHLCLLQIEKVTSATIRDRLYHEQSIRILDEAEALRHSSRLEEKAHKAKSEFLALMSHELRTPLNVIIGFADILKDELLGPHSISQYKDYSTDISQAGHHLLNLINDILDISKIDSGKYSLQEEVVDVTEVIRSAESLVRHQVIENDQNLLISFPDDLPDLNVDSRSLKQMLVNLLSNAVKFTPDGGQIELTIFQNDNKDLIFSVRDNGIGIAQHEIPLIIQPFTQSEANMTRHKPGTGLGLALVKKMVEMHEGSIDIKSQIGKGTTVTLTFPANRVVAI